MEIVPLKQNGVPQAEREAHQQIKKAFDSTPFSKHWKGYASFALVRQQRGAGDDDFDLVLITHTNIVVIELKNWHGKVLKSDGQEWYVDGERKDTSPVKKSNLNAKKLASKMTQKLGRKMTPFIYAYVVLHGDIETITLPDEEKLNVLNMKDILNWRYNAIYKDYFKQSKSNINPLNYLVDYDKFFRGSNFKPKNYYINGFCPGDSPIFEHPKELYKEFKAYAKDDFKKLALLRAWNFNAPGVELIGEKDRAFIGLREQRIFEHVEAINEELLSSLLRPVTRNVENDVTINFQEIYFLPNKITRLEEFPRKLAGLSQEDRLLLIKTLLSRFADLHDLKIAHRDIGQHSLWLDLPAKIVMSGFQAADFPTMQTVGALSKKIKVEQSIYPPSATPYEQDVFMLGVVVYLLLYGEAPPKPRGIFEWSARAEEPLHGDLDVFFAKALNSDPGKSFQNAREMLEAFNAATDDRKQAQIIDPTMFAAFEAVTRERDYEYIDTIEDSNDALFFRTTDGTKLVKVWYGISLDDKNPDQARHLLSFLERARDIKSCDISGLPKIYDFGLSRRSLLLVLEWVEGKNLTDWLNTNPSFEKRLILSHSIIDTIERIHVLELAHGDLHPQNIIIKDDDIAILIDILDFRINTNDQYTTAYLPDNYKSLSQIERDRYSIAAILKDILGYSSTIENPETGIYPIPQIYKEISNLLEANTLSSLEPLSRAVVAATKVETQEIPKFTVKLKNIEEKSFKMRQVNGNFYVEVNKDKNFENSIMFTITGIDRRLYCSWNFIKQKTNKLTSKKIPQNLLFESQRRKDMHIPLYIDILKDKDDSIDDLIQYLLTNKTIHDKIYGVSNHKDSFDEIKIDTEDYSNEIHVSISELWNELIKAEEASFVTVRIIKRIKRKDKQVILQCHKWVNEFQDSDTVLVFSQTKDKDDWRRCGILNLKERKDTPEGLVEQLVIDDFDARVNLSRDSQLQLRSTLQIASFSRRQSAMQHILDGKALIPDLVEYFEPKTAHKPMEHIASTEDTLDSYSEGGRQLNNSQRKAFNKVLSNGPISLVQGPPGTGKTWFIATLLHYLMKHEKARHILLVSQTHEAVNNALGKSQEICRGKGEQFNAVRLGDESRSSLEIYNLHAISIEQSYRELFKAEQKERIIDVVLHLGLPKKFIIDFIDIYHRLFTIYEHINELESRKSDNTNNINLLESHIKSNTEAFYDISVNDYGLSKDFSLIDTIKRLEEELMNKYGVHSQDAVDRLKKLIRLSGEWGRILGSRKSNFAEFLAKSRTVVAGTLVGIGYRGTGVLQNIFDWVIIDEAGRATSSEIAVAIQAGKRILMVGDHLQLLPTFPQEVKDIICRRYSLSQTSPLFNSDFERIFNSAYGKKVGVTLTTQYRMAADIGELVSTCFYGDKLDTGRGNPPQYFNYLSCPLDKQIIWIDTASLGKDGFEQSSGKDKWNQKEAKMIINLLQQFSTSADFLKYLRDNLREHEIPIGIISMYSKQCDIIEELKSQEESLIELEGLIKVGTVDSYQGKENKIIILSTVRNNKDFEYGFLDSPNRINVAISRAMERLIIVGSSKMWSGDNSSTPLGKVFSKVQELTTDGRANIFDAENLRGIK
ncbi:MAG: NERD domain-containing protein [Desulfovibrio sp.]|jgi:superfamily I DNA and/or RNA helicase|nr:NERD domain-containing protein [Desulfovibrio sp.]